MIRLLAVLAGAGLLGATAYVTVVATGGFDSEHAPIVIAVAIGVAVASACIGKAISERRYGLALLMLICTLAGEAYSLVATAERVVAARDSQQAPLAASVAGQRAGLSRLAAVEAAKKTADEALLAKASDKSCLKNCRALLEGAVAAAKAEVDEARKALTDPPAARSSTPLADRVGLPGWALDLMQALLLSVGANGLGACLLAYGTHPSRSRTVHLPVPIALRASPAPQLAIERPITGRDNRRLAEHAADFGVDRLKPGGHARLSDILATYRAWCRSRGFAPLPDAEIGNELSDLFLRAGCRGGKVKGQPAILGISVK